MHKATVTAGILVCATLVASATFAEVPAKVRIGLDTGLFEFSSGWREFDRPRDPKQDFQHATGGIGLPTWGIIVAGAVTQSIVLGVRAHAAATTDDPYFGNDLAFKYGGDFLFEYIFLGGIVRPFVTFQAGIDGYVNHPDDDSRHNDWWIAFGGDAGGGLHVMARPALSFDLTALAGVHGGPGGERNGDDYHHFRFSTGILFGISGWLR